MPKPHPFPKSAAFWATAVFLFAVLGLFFLDAFMKKKTEGPVVDGRTVGQWITDAPVTVDEEDPAVLALRKAGPAALPHLATALKYGYAKFHWFSRWATTSPAEIRLQAASVLIALRSGAAPVVPAVLECAGSPDKDIRNLALEVLGSAGVSNEAVRRTLLDALGDPDCQYQASLSLGLLGRDDPKIVEELITLASGNQPGAYYATVTLGEIAPNPNAKAALPALIKLIDSPKSDKCQHAVQAIALMAPDSQAAIPGLMHVLEAGDTWAQKCAIIALGRMGPPAVVAVPALHRLFDKGDEDLVADIARALWRIDPGQLDFAMAWARKRLPGEMKSKPGQGSTSEMDLLGEMGPAARAALPDILPGLADSDPRQRLAAAVAICRISPAENAAALKELRELFDNPPSHGNSPGYEAQAYLARLAAAGALWQFDLTRRPEYQRAIAGMLKKWSYHTSFTGITPAQTLLVPALGAILEDATQAPVHPAATAALLRISGVDGERW